MTTKTMMINKIVYDIDKKKTRSELPVFFTSFD